MIFYMLKIVIQEFFFRINFLNNGLAVLELALEFFWRKESELGIKWVGKLFFLLI